MEISNEIGSKFGCCPFASRGICVDFVKAQKCSWYVGLLICTVAITVVLRWRSGEPMDTPLPVPPNPQPVPDTTGSEPTLKAGDNARSPTNRFENFQEALNRVNLLISQHQHIEALALCEDLSL